MFQKYLRKYLYIR